MRDNKHAFVIFG